MSYRSFFVLAAVVAAAGCTRPVAIDRTDPAALRAHAERIAQESIIVDGHIDVPYRLTEHDDDISGSTELDGAIVGDFDYPRAQAGGLDAPFMSIYIPSRLQDTPGASRALADSLIDMVESWVAASPDKFAIARTVADVRRHHRQGLVSLPMGMENGSPIDDLDDLRHFYDRGIRYVTLAHARDNQHSDSSYDTTRTWNGLSPLGEEMVRGMNQLGIMVDISHLSDSAAFDVLRLTRAPVIASHSSVRRYTPGWERNMGDDLIRAVGANGGVIMINFGSSFLRQEYQAEGTRVQREIVGYLARNGLDRDSPEGIAYFRQQRKQNPVGTLDDVVAHIDHVVDLVGIDHVGLGSDFDGVFALPDGLDDVSDFPNLVYALLERGYSEEDIRKILGENALRVWREVEQVAGR